MGMHSGVPDASHITHNRATGRTQYTGPSMAITKVGGPMHVALLCIIAPRNKPSSQPNLCMHLIIKALLKMH
jgi:hypothetical protein